MLRSPSKRCESESDLTKVNVTFRKRKHDDELVETFHEFSDKIMKQLECWKTDLDTNIATINDNLNEVMKKDLSKLTQSSLEMRNEISSIRKEYSEIKQSVQNLQTEQESIKKNVDCLQNSMQFSSDRQDDLSRKMDSITLDAKKIDILQNELVDLKNQNKQLIGSLNSNDQRDRLLNLEIKGIPESKNEDTKHVVFSLLQKYGTNITINDIVFANRVSPRIKIHGRPRIIIARMCSRTVKDNILSRSRKLRLTTKDINIQGDPRPIYVSEHLTSYNKTLLNKCKEVAKSKNYQFVWTKNGRIYIRKCETAPALIINTEEDLKKI